MNFEGRFSRFRFPRRFLQEEHSYFVKSLLNRFWFCLEMKIHRHSISLFPRNIVCIQTNLRKRPINKNKRQLTNFELPLLCPLLLLALLSAEVLRSVPFKLFCGVGEIGPLPVGIFLCFVSFPRRSYFSFLEPPTRARLSVICLWLDLLLLLWLLSLDFLQLYNICSNVKANVAIDCGSLWSISNVCMGFVCFSSVLFLHVWRCLLADSFCVP